MFFRKNSQLDTQATSANYVIIWDVGGVILDWNPSKFAEKYNNGQYQKECLAIFQHENWNKFDRGDLSYQDLKILYSKQLNLSEIAVDAILQAAFHSLAPHWPVINFIQQLTHAGYKQYCLTNGSKEYLKHVTSKKFHIAYGFSFNELFNNDQIVLSANIHKAKPELEIYQHTLTTFNLEKRKVIFIDDSQKNVQGAIKAGWHGAIHFTNLESCIQLLEKYLNIDLDPDRASLNDLLKSDFGKASNTAKRLS